MGFQWVLNHIIRYYMNDNVQFTEFTDLLNQLGCQDMLCFIFCFKCRSKILVHQQNCLRSEESRMKVDLKPFLALRIYKDVPTFKITNALLCNTLMRSQFLVDNAPSMYKMSTKLLGQQIPGFFLRKTFCDVLTAGNTLQQANKKADELRKHNIQIIMDYCAEGYLNNKEQQATLDANSEQFAISAKKLVHQKSQMSSIKISGLVDMKLLYKMNDAVININRFWQQNSKEGRMSAQQLFNGIQKLYAGINEQKFREYLKNIHRYQGQTQKFQTDEIGFKMNHHPFYIEHSKNQDFIINLFMPLTPQEKSQGYNLIRRLEEICQPCAENQNNFRILVDAQQTYIQRAIESISQQLQAKYNKDKVLILPTLQNYLKRSYGRCLYEIEIAKRRKLKFGIKLVRGAYIVEETQLALKNRAQNPIQDGKEKTTANYHRSLETIVSTVKQGEVVVASHNQGTIQYAQKLREQYPSNLKINYAQLLGLADHLTWKLKHEGLTVYKLLPWAKTDVMVAYMIRRAIELKQMGYPLDTQSKLLKHQLKNRFL